MNINFIKNRNIKPLSALHALILIIFVAYIIYSQITYTRKIDSVEQQLSNKTTVINQKVSDIETILLATQEENTTIAEALEAAQEKSETLESKFRKVNDNVDDLTKITTTDKELLQKYSKVFFLNEHYAPADLHTIPSKYTYDKDRKYEIHNDVWPYLEDLLQAAAKDDVSIQIISAFRSFGEQATLKGAYTVTYGAGTANQFSADQGYSEHQLGTTVDFTTPSVGATFSGFAQTEEYKWLRKNAHRWGFTMSYPENNSYYQFEPWHWRFVGEDLADDLYDDEKYFYDLTQREIDEYIISLFD